MQKNMRKGTYEKMEIDILKAKEAFEKYVQKYDIKDEKVLLKIKHTYKVVENSKKIAERLNLSEEQKSLAQLIALLHDIGRFEQLRIYNTFVDSMSVNHAEQGIKVLFEENKIRDFIKTDKYDQIINKAIINHNRSNIEEGLDQETLLQAKIIRDSDKIDIYRVITEEKPQNVLTIKTNDMEHEKITDSIYKQFMKKEKLDYKNIRTNMDIIFTWLAYTYDFNFSKSKQEVMSQEFIDKITAKVEYKDIETKQKIEIATKQAKIYLNE